VKVLVTGANGFVGRAVLERLRRDGYAVRAAIRTNSGMLPPDVERTTGDLHPDRDWSDSLHGVDVVIHLAARVHVMRETAADQLDEYRRVNVDGTVNLASCAAAAGVRRFVFVSTLKVNGEAGRFTEHDGPAPAGPYAQSKHEAEVALRRIAKEHGFEVVIIRPPLVYGPGVQANFGLLMRVIARGIPLPLGAIRNQRSLIGIDNLVDFITACLAHPAAANETFLVADDEDLSTPDLVRRLARAMGRPARLFPMPSSLLRLGASLCGRRDDADRLLNSLQADISKARTRLSWSPPVSVDDALRRAAQSR
jgi:UDP-N-acetyl-alpha-D-quinovosamine dehydrogenase